MDEQARSVGGPSRGTSPGVSNRSWLLTSVALALALVGAATSVALLPTLVSSLGELLSSSLPQALTEQNYGGFLAARDILALMLPMAAVVTAASIALLSGATGLRLRKEWARRLLVGLAWIATACALVVALAGRSPLGALVVGLAIGGPALALALFLRSNRVRAECAGRPPG